MENSIVKRMLDVSSVELNDGQIQGLPRNPRTWTYTDVERLKASIKETPELLDARGVIVFPFEGKYVAVGGNMRLVALKSLGEERVPCIVLPDDMPVEKLREIVIKDNGSFGKWDEELLSEDWNGIPFAEWGVDIFETDDQDEKESFTEESDDRKEFKIVFEADEFEYVNNRLREINSVKEAAFLQLIRGGEADDGE